MEKEKRFKVIYTEGKLEYYRIIVDTVTGVNYLSVRSGYAGGLTVLRDAEGKPVITKNI